MLRSSKCELGTGWTCWKRPTNGSKPAKINNWFHNGITVKLLGSWRNTPLGYGRARIKPLCSSCPVLILIPKSTDHAEVDIVCQNCSILSHNCSKILTLGITCGVYSSYWSRAWFTLDSKEQSSTRWNSSKTPPASAGKALTCNLGNLGPDLFSQSGRMGFTCCSRDTNASKQYSSNSVSFPDSVLHRKKATDSFMLFLALIC